jgi:hypothetical protein
MRRLLPIIFVSAIFAANTAAWKLVASYRCPVTDARGYAWNGMTTGWTISRGPAPYICYIGLVSSTIISSFPAPGGAGAWGVANRSSGLALYVSNNQTSWIFEMTTTGSLYGSFRCPVPGPAGLDIRGFPISLYIAIPDRNVIAVVNPTTGSLVSTFKGPGSRPTACCGYGMLLVADSATHTIYEDGVPVIRGIQTPVGIDEDHTLGYGVDHFIWILDAATNYVYRYDKLTGVEPASLGRVKALFR